MPRFFFSSYLMFILSSFDSKIYERMSQEKSQFGVGKKSQKKSRRIGFNLVFLSIV